MYILVSLYHNTAVSQSGLNAAVLSNKGGDLSGEGIVNADVVMLHEIELSCHLPRCVEFYVTKSR